MGRTAETRAEDLRERHRIERQKWDADAQARATALDVPPPEDDFHRYARRVATMPGVSEFLGDLTGKQVLEYGCGLGQIATLLARSGAAVTTFDLSPGAVTVASERTRAAGVDGRVRLVAAAGESLPFGDAAFDVIVGKAILHHLDVDLGVRELHRVLRPGGKAVFVEPLGMNPLLNLARARLPYVGKHERGADRPVIYDEINRWGAPFARFRYREIQLLSMVERAIGFGTKLPRLRRADDALLARFPRLRRYCRYVVMFCEK